MLEQVSISNEYLRIKLHDLALIYRLFEEKIQKDYIDTDSRLTVLSELIPQSTMLQNAKIWIDEFDSFTELWTII
jgi:ATP-dependent helicase/nuclease subunit B